MAGKSQSRSSWHVGSSWQKFECVLNDNLLGDQALCELEPSSNGVVLKFLLSYFCPVMFFFLELTGAGHSL